MIKLMSLLENDLVKIDKGISSLTGPTASPEQQMIRIPQLNWSDFLKNIKTKLEKTQNITDDKAWKLTYGIFGGQRILTPKMFGILKDITPLQIETLDFYTEGNASTIIQRAKEHYNEFEDAYNAGYGKLRGHQKANKF